MREEAADAGLRTLFFLMKLMSPLRSTRATRILSNFFSRALKTEIFFQIVFGNVISSHGAETRLPSSTIHLRPAFDQNAEPVGVIGHQGEEPVEEDEHHPAAKRRKKRSAAVDRARKTDARMTIRTASKAVLRASERLCPSRTIMSVATKTMIPRSEI